jgi:type IV secretion system protein VirD4
VAIWLGAQSLAQLEARYGRAHAQKILTNCAMRVALHGLDVLTAEYVSRMLGDATVAVNRRSHTTGTSFHNGGTSVTHSRTEHRRPLLTPDEVMRLGEGEAPVRTSNRHPMRLPKMYYDEPPRTAQAGALGPARAVEITPQAPPPVEEPPKLPEMIN